MDLLGNRRTAAWSSAGLVMARSRYGAVSSWRESRGSRTVWRPVIDTSSTAEAGDDDGGVRVSAVAGFLPSVAAFRFTNSFVPEPLFTVGLCRSRSGPAAARPGAVTLTAGRLGIGDASRGLCGGMIFAVRDLFEAGLEPPADAVAPRAGSPLYAYLVRRLFESFDIPRGVARYYQLMRGPDADQATGILVRPGVGRASVVDEWPRIRLDLDSGLLSPLGIVTLRSSDPRQLGLNHQVLAYAYAQRGTSVTLRVYDPNTPSDRADDVTLTFDLADPAGPVPIRHSIAIGGRPVRAFFRGRYRWKDPSAAVVG